MFKGGGNAKRKKSDDDDELDDRLEDEDYDLIEENLGVKVERVSTQGSMILKYAIYNEIDFIYYPFFFFC